VHAGIPSETEAQTLKHVRFPLRLYKERLTHVKVQTINFTIQEHQ